MDLKQVNDSIVDLRKSTWDKATSNPKEGIFNFTKKVTVPMRGNSGAEHELTWSRYAAENGYRELNAHRAEGFVPVLADQGLYYPQGAFKNAAGMWQYGDVVLIMRPMVQFLRKRKEDVTAGFEAVKANQRKFESELAADGSNPEGNVIDIQKV